MKDKTSAQKRKSEISQGCLPEQKRSRREREAISCGATGRLIKEFKLSNG